MSKPERQFKGVWIPKEIWNIEPARLSWMEKCLLAEITVLEDDEAGCTASNKYLADVFDSTESSIANQLSTLRSLGLIDSIYNGKRRSIRTLHPGVTTTSPAGEVPLHPAVKSHSKREKVEKKEESEGFLQELPLSLDCEEFIMAWRGYVAYRKSSGLKALPPVTIKQRFSEFEKWGVSKSIEAINHSIKNAWKGIFPPNENQKITNPNGTKSARREKIRVPVSDGKGGVTYITSGE